jgi:hypothetical protein
MAIYQKIPVGKDTAGSNRNRTRPRTCLTSIRPLQRASSQRRRLRPPHRRPSILFRKFRADNAHGTQVVLTLTVCVVSPEEPADAKAIKKLLAGSGQAGEKVQPPASPKKQATTGLSPLKNIHCPTAAQWKIKPKWPAIRRHRNRDSGAARISRPGCSGIASASFA